MGRDRVGLHAGGEEGGPYAGLSTWCDEDTLTIERGSVGVREAEVDKPKLAPLTTLRGLAAVWVVIYHFQDVLYATVDLARFFRLVIAQGHLAVDLFFMLSGFVLAYNYMHRIRLDRPACLRFWLLRLARIYPAHLVGLLVVALMLVGVRVLGLSVTEGGYTLGTFVQHLTLTQAWVPSMKLSWNYPAWSVSSEWLAYLLFPLIAIAVRSLAAVAGGFAMLVGIAGIVGLSTFVAPETPFVALVRVLVAFPIGVALFAMSEIWSTRPLVGWFGGAGVLSVVALMCTNAPAYPLTLVLFLSLIGFLAVLGPRSASLFAPRPLLWLGEISYSLYISHALVQKILNEAMPAVVVGEFSLLARLVCLAGYTATVVVTAQLFWRLVEVPSREALRLRVERVCAHVLRRT